MLAREFDSSSVAVKLEGKEEHGAKSLCTVVLENTGEELHVQPILVQGVALLEVAHEQLKRRLDELRVLVKGQVKQDAHQISARAARRLHFQAQDLEETGNES